MFSLDFADHIGTVEQGRGLFAPSPNKALTVLSFLFFWRQGLTVQTTMPSTFLLTLFVELISHLVVLSNFGKKWNNLCNLVVYIFNPNTWEAKAGKSL